MQTGPNLSPARTPSHEEAGCGGFHRSSPTGGEPNGIPLNDVTPSTLPGTPETSPLAVRTGSLNSRELSFRVSAAVAFKAADARKPKNSTDIGKRFMSHLYL